MCGIAGFVRTDGAPCDQGALSSMIEAMHHRGPNDQGMLVDGGTALGSTRLSIQDLSSAGHMPFMDPETNVAIIHNGEVYNFKELRRELGGDYRTGTDTEVVLQAYLERGLDFLDMLNGIYGFAIWDPRIRRLILVRDRLGVKPLFVAEQNGAIAFASEIKALLAMGIEAQPNLECFADYLLHGVYEHSQDSFFSGIKQLQPGHYAIIENGMFQQHAYWSLPQRYEAITPPSSFDEGVDRFIEISHDALRMQLRSDVPVAAHVSGGLDSAYMLASLNAIQGGQGNIKALSYHFGEEAYDERPAVEGLVADMGWQASYVKLVAEDVPELAKEGMFYQEQPFPGIVTLAKHKLIKETVGLGATVILEGQGGDEIGAGYQYVMGGHIHDLLRSGQSARAMHEIEQFAVLNDLSAVDAYRKIMGSMAVIWNTGWSADGSRFIKPDSLGDDLPVRDKPTFKRPFESELLNVQYRDLFHTKLPRILRACDRASMAYSRELRVPVLDHRLVEFVFSLPAEYKIKDGAQRTFYRAALARLFPTQLSAAPKKAVADPQRDWLRGPLKEWAGDILNSQSFSGRGLVNQKVALKEFDAFCSEEKGTGNSFFIWQWLSTELWFQTFIDQQTYRSSS